MSPENRIEIELVKTAADAVLAAATAAMAAHVNETAIAILNMQPSIAGGRARFDADAAAIKAVSLQRAIDEATVKASALQSILTAFDGGAA